VSATLDVLDDVVSTHSQDSRRSPGSDASEAGKRCSHQSAVPAEELEVDMNLMRGLSLRQSLHTFGILWLVSPETRYPCRVETHPVPKFDVFVSHTWRTPGRWKILCLMYQTGWELAFFLQTLVATVLLVLGLNGTLPLPTTTTIAGIPPEQYEASPWMRASSLPTMILGLCIAPYVGDLFNKQVAFIDMASIDQTDPVQKEQGISHIAGFLKKSDELQVMWSVDYLSRLWCVFELAAYRTANPSGKITLMPLFVEKTFAVLIVAVYGFTSVWVLAEAKFIPLGSEVWIFGVALIPVGLAAHALRKSFLSKHQLLTALANFELESSTCSSDFDRRFILRCIRRWYGGPEQFESFVRRELREELLAQIRSTSFRSGYYLVTVVPSVCAGLDSLVCLWRGQAPTAALVTHFVCLVLAFDICWIVITFKLVLLLSDGSAQLCLGRFRFFDYVISLTIFVASGVIFMAGLVGSRLARNTLSVSTALSWLALSCILMALTSDCVWRQVRALRRRSKV